MSQTVTKITLICDANTEQDIENALINSGIQFNKEEVKEPTKAYVFRIPNVTGVIFHVLHILEAKKDVIKGNIELADGTKYELTQEGISQLNELLIGVMYKKREETVSPQFVWWTPFIPQIQRFLDKLTELMDWYPKAMGKGKRDVTLVFVGLIGAIVVGMWLLTYFNKVSGDSFVFVIGALLGYIFAFLQRYLGILSE
jgi:hypothetical protein